MEAFGALREEWLRQFLGLPHGIPDGGTFRQVFERRGPEALAKCLYDWLGGYVIGLKGHQPALMEDGSLYFQEFIRELPCLVARDKDHERIEKREYRLLTGLSRLPGRSGWDGLKAAGCACATVAGNGATSTDARFFITSLTGKNPKHYAEG